MEAKRKPELKLSVRCRNLAEELYKKMHFPGKGGQGWGEWDDAREIQKIEESILEIAKDAYTSGSNDTYEIWVKCKTLTET